MSSRLCLCARSCQGRRFEWCSMIETRMALRGLNSSASARDWAARLMAAVVPGVKMRDW